jgi:hypothetical protein
VKHVKKILAVAFAVLSLISYYLGIYTFAMFNQLLEIGFIDATTLVLAIVCFIAVVVSVFSIKGLLETKITKQTYAFAFLVTAISSTLHVIGNFILKFDLSLEFIVLFSIIISTPLSCILSGYARGTLLTKLKDLIMDQGITLLTLLILSSIPIIQFATYQTKIINTGTIAGPPVIFEEGNDTAQINYALTNVLFEAQTTLESNSTILFNQIAKISNQISYEVELSYFFEWFHGNINEIEQLRIFFKFDNGSTIPILSIVNDNINFETHKSIKIKEASSVSIGLNCSIGEMVATNLILNCQMKLDQLNLFIDIEIE